MPKPAQVCKSLQKHAKACNSMHKYAESMQKVCDFFLPFWKFVTTFHNKFLWLFLAFCQILCQLFPAFFKFCFDFFPPFFDNFRRLKTTFFVLFCMGFSYAVQSLSRQYKRLSPFLGGGGGLKAIPRTALLLSITIIQKKQVWSKIRYMKR